MVIHTNTLKARKYAPYWGSSIKNCAACTAAGAINLTVGQTAHSSGMVAAGLHKRDGKLTMGDSTKAQAQTIGDYVATKTGRSIVRSNEEMPLTEAEDWMLSHPNRTVFAVLVSGNVPYHNEEKCHWLNAILAGGTIRYFDFQSQRSGGAGGDFTGHANPATSTKPFVAVITQAEGRGGNRELHQSSQIGTFDNKARLTIIAFPP